MTSGRDRDDDITKTTIDLGEDLLEKTAILATPAPAATHAAPEEEALVIPVQGQVTDLEDLLQSAQILMGEGLIDEAKKILRRIILADPHHVTARQKLDEIHEIELKQIFSEGYIERPNRKKTTDPLRVNADEVMRSLDRDLKLGIFHDDLAEIAIDSELLGGEHTLFPSRESMEDFGKKLDLDLAGSQARDRMDVGIAFLEMGLYDLAARQFKSASRDPEHNVAATSLLAYSLILAGRPFEATLSIEPILGDSELSKEDRIHFFYLMGRAHERLQKPGVALQWYRQAASMDPHYRDLQERIRVLTGKR